MKKDLFDDDERIDLTFNNDKERKDKLFSGKNGRLLFELNKTFKSDERFKMTEEFLDDINVDKLPESVGLNYLRGETMDDYEAESKKDIELEKGDKELGLIINDNDLWKENNRYYQVLERVCKQEIQKVKKQKKFVKIIRYDPSKHQKLIIKDKIPLASKLIKKPVKKMKIKKRRTQKKNANLESNSVNPVKKRKKKEVKINFQEFKKIAKMKETEFKLFN